MANLQAPSMVLILVLLSMVAYGGSEEQKFCNMTEDQLMACKPYVTDPDTHLDPSPDCCSGLCDADLPCLCSYRNSLVFMALGINSTLAMQLPAKCNLTTPAQC
ncbi:hypothetical protein QJS10_CPB04g01406 [Acorus calamus]|uniref:Bifunctional inhibitor/plant lipid transfer protein/seed storage helical domain-containing protein n=1 Tax=Acorus calamus TaxID=4465 RepID=A0AAV9F0U3_ACOCL|nr:hypothetical protein QJS10_CPB04g01406 [Acorus calamus]